MQSDRNAIAVRYRGALVILTVLIALLLAGNAHAGPGDFNGDGDVDGTDLYLWVSDPGQLALSTFAANFGATGLYTGTVYYVSSVDGNDDHDGLTPDMAWQTLANVNLRTFQPGDAILFKRGATFRETLQVASKGTPDAWVTYGVYGPAADPKPRFLGSEQATGWTEVSTSIWQSATAVTNPYQGGYSYGEVFFENLDGTHAWGRHRGFDAAFSTMERERDWCWDNNRIYVYATANPQNAYRAVEVPQRDVCIQIRGVSASNPPENYSQYIAFENLEIMYAMRSGINGGYNEIEAHGFSVTHCHIGCIGVRGGASAYGVAAWYSDMHIANNVFHDCGRRAVSLNTYTSYTPGLTIRNVTIDGNHFSNGYHTTGPDISSISGLGHTFSGFTISNNVLDDTGRAAEGINDGCYASSCTSNSIYINANGNTYTDFKIVNNLIVGSTSRAILIHGGSDVGIYHNTIYGSHPEAHPYSLVTFSDTRHVDLRNNIIHGTLPNAGASDGRCVLSENGTNFTIRNHNLYYQEDATQPFSGSDATGVEGWNNLMSEWADWRARTGYESAGPEPGDPLFADPVNGDFNLLKDSPAVGAGALIAGINENYEGGAPDLGAFESPFPGGSVVIDDQASDTPVIRNAVALSRSAVELAWDSVYDR